MMHDAAASSSEQQREASSTGPLLVRSPRLTRLACHVVLSPAPHAVLVLCWALLAPALPSPLLALTLRTLLAPLPFPLPFSFILA